MTRKTAAACIVLVAFMGQAPVKAPDNNADNSPVVKVTENEPTPTELPLVTVEQSEVATESGRLTPVVEPVVPDKPILTVYSADWCPACPGQIAVLESVTDPPWELVIDKSEPSWVPWYPYVIFDTPGDGWKRLLPGRYTGEQILETFNQFHKQDDSSSPESRDSYQHGTITKINTEGVGAGTAVCVGKLPSGEWLFACCHHQVGDVQTVEVFGHTGRVVWKHKAGEDDAALVAVNIDRDFLVADLHPGEYTGRATCYGYGGDYTELKHFSGTVQFCREHGLELKAPVPSFWRQGMSGGPVVGVEGRVVGIYYGFTAVNGDVNKFTPASVYIDAIKRLADGVPPAVSAASIGPSARPSHTCPHCGGSLQ